MRTIGHLGIAVLLAITFVGATPFAAAQVTVDLRQYGFPAPSNDRSFLEMKLGVFYTSTDVVGVFFDRQPAAESQSHDFQVILIVNNGQVKAQRVIRGDPKALDIIPAPNAGVFTGKAGELQWYDSALQLVRSISLSADVTGVQFERRFNELVVLSVDVATGRRMARFLMGDTLEPSAILTYPMKSHAIFGLDQMAYSVGGECSGSAHVLPEQRKWDFLSAVAACDALAFITNEKLAYAFDRHLHVVDSNRKQVLNARIPVADTFHMPDFAGISDDGNRLALIVLKRKLLARGWPYSHEVIVFDLRSGGVLLRRELHQSTRLAAVLSPNGRELAVLENGVLTLTAVP